MLQSFLKSKIHRATVTQSNLDYDGSISICKKLMESARLSLNEKVLVCNLENGNRFETYVIEGTKGQIGVNGAAAHLAKIGDKILIMSFALLNQKEAENLKPIIIKPDEENTV